MIIKKSFLAIPGLANCDLDNYTLIYFRTSASVIRAVLRLQRMAAKNRKKDDDELLSVIGTEL